MVKVGMSRGFASLVTVLTVVVLAGCTQSGGASVTLRETDGGRTVELKRGDTLIVELEGIPTTGFQWEVTSVNEAVLKQEGDPEYKDSEPGRMGGGGLLIFSFKALGTGRTELKMVYHQPWEKDTLPAKTFDINVVVE
jgi:inhibitor of cysteine peptidase